MKRFLFLTLLSLPLPAFAQVIPGGLPLTGTLNVSADRTLTRDVTGRIRITADNVTLDCAGHTISPWLLGKQCGTHGGGCGIIVEGRTNVTLRNCEVTDHDIGVWIGTSSNVIVETS